MKPGYVTGFIFMFNMNLLSFLFYKYHTLSKTSGKIVSLMKHRKTHAFVDKVIR
ncbi:hypothetical protein VIBNIAM115_230025 [Vibrio nigripulchritudo AM115]|nr:hypothetical protein VIBNIAM115_230025 [Vibrio nigripulchritudo AM115]